METVPTEGLTQPETGKETFYIEYIPTSTFATCIVAIVVALLYFNFIGNRPFADYMIRIPINIDMVKNGSHFSVEFDDLPLDDYSLGLYAPSESKVTLAYECSVDLNNINDALRLPFSPPDARITVKNTSETVKAHFHVILLNEEHLKDIVVTLASLTKPDVSGVFHLVIKWTCLLIITINCVIIFVKVLTSSMCQIIFCANLLSLAGIFYCETFQQASSLLIGVLISVAMMLSITDSASVTLFLFEALAYVLVSQIQVSSRFAWISRLVFIVAACAFACGRMTILSMRDSITARNLRFSIIACVLMMIGCIFLELVRNYTAMYIFVTAMNSLFLILVWPASYSNTYEALDDPNADTSLLYAIAEDLETMYEVPEPPVN